MSVLEGERHEKVRRTGAEDRCGGQVRRTGVEERLEEKRSGEKARSEKTRRKKPPLE